MQNYRKTSHSTYDIKYHIVWITKYRKPVMTGKIGLSTRGCFAASSGNVTDEVIAEYIRFQDAEEYIKNDDFNVSNL